MLLVIDNYDSFTYNLVQYFGRLGVPQKIYRNDQITLPQAIALKPDRILISPGPCSPNEAGISLPIIHHFSGKTPLLGVCLGHQAIAQNFGAKIVRAQRLMHGKTSPILHQNQAIFSGLPNPFPATRYHSLIADPATIPSSLEVIAHTAEGEIMGLRHREYPLWGVQFHPESIATPQGLQILQNFLNLS